MEAWSRWKRGLRAGLERTYSGAGRAMARAADHRALGQGLVEYALIIALVAVVVIGAVTAVGKRTSQVFDQAQCTLDGGTMHTDNGNGNSNRCR